MHFSNLSQLQLPACTNTLIKGQDSRGIAANNIGLTLLFDEYVGLNSQPGSSNGVRRPISQARFQETRTPIAHTRSRYLPSATDVLLAV